MIKELEVLNQIQNLKGAGSNKSKQELLSSNATEIMKYLLEVAFHPFKTTKIAKIEQTSPELYTHEEDHFGQFKAVLNTLFESKAANNELRQIVSNLVYGLDTTNENRELLRKIITKSLNIGVGIKSINKAFGYEFLPDLSVMLAEDDPSELEKWPEIHAEIKYDGVRVLAIYDKKQNYFKFITRSFNELNCLCLQNITRELLAIAEKNNLEHNLFFDGELTDKDRKSVSGKVNKILSDTAPLDIDKDFVFNIFDIEQYSLIQESKIGELQYLKRRELLKQYFTEVNTQYLQLSESWVLKSIEEVSNLFKQVVINGGEGLICKNPEHVYTPKRDKNWTKMKEVNECDLKIVNWFDGTGKRAEKGHIGGFSLESEDRLLKVNCGSGFDDILMEEIIKNGPDSYIGKIVSVQYNVKIQDKDNNYSLFLPRLVEIRNDKQVANTLKEIK